MVKKPDIRMDKKTARTSKYKASIVQTAGGMSHARRIVSESLMPRGLLDQLSESEVLDLLAYTLSRGHKHDGRFQK